MLGLVESSSRHRKQGLTGKIQFPLYAQIIIGLILGLVVGVLMGPSARILEWPARLVLRVLGAVAPPLILVAVVHALVQAELPRRMGLRLGWLLITNTLIAIGIGLTVANLIRPGDHAELVSGTPPAKPGQDVALSLLDNVPGSFVAPFVDGRVLGVVLIAVAVGLAGRRLGEAERTRLADLAALGSGLLRQILEWILVLVPLAVFGKVASIVGVEGFRPFVSLLWFVVAVLVALAGQGIFYLIRLRLGSWVKLRELATHLTDPLTMAFSTASSTVTMPVTYERLRRVGLRERSASLGALVGSNFNNDGTALYEAMAALFVAQMLGVSLSWTEQGMVVLTSVVASVGAAGIPEAGLVTMTLVFTAVGLPTEAIAFLLAVDWFLDRARTTINVLGDVTVACLLDGRVRAEDSALAHRKEEPLRSGGSSAGTP